METFAFSSIFKLFHSISFFLINILGARISVSDGTLTIVAKNQAVMEKAQEKVIL